MKHSNEETQQFKSLRRFFKIYVRGIRGASELRHQLMSTETVDEARALLDDFEANMEDNHVKLKFLKLNNKNTLSY